MQPKVTEGHGRIVKLMGDGLLAEFPSVVEAVQCAVDIQNTIIEREADLPNERRIRLRVGINLGDIIVEGDDIYGDGVNVAARLESLAEPGAIFLSGDVYRQAKNQIDAELEYVGEQTLKNISEPVQVYRIVVDQSAPSAVTENIPHLDKPRIAVLPFVNMSGDPEQEFLSDGFSEEIITSLARFRSLNVISRNSTFHTKTEP